MKIDPRIQLPGDAQPDRVKGSRKGSVQQSGNISSSGVSSPSGEDTVRLSSTHGEIQTLAANLQKVPEVRVDRVNALQKQVRDGQFQPDNQKIADAIVAEHSRLNTKA